MEMEMEMMRKIILKKIAAFLGQAVAAVSLGFGAGAMLGATVGLFVRFF